MKGGRGIVDGPRYSTCPWYESGVLTEWIMNGEGSATLLDDGGASGDTARPIPGELRTSRVFVTGRTMVETCCNASRNCRPPGGVDANEAVMVRWRVNGLPVDILCAPSPEMPLVDIRTLGSTDEGEGGRVAGFGGGGVLLREVRLKGAGEEGREIVDAIVFCMA